MQPQRVAGTGSQVPQRVDETAAGPVRLVHQLWRRVAYPRGVDHIRRGTGPIAVVVGASRVVSKTARQPAAVIRGNRPLVDHSRAPVGIGDVARAAPNRDPRANRQRAGTRIAGADVVVCAQEIAAALAEHHRPRPTQGLGAVKIHLTVCRTRRIAQVRRRIQRQAVDKVDVGVVVARQVQIASRRHPVQRPAGGGEEQLRPA